MLRLKLLIGLAASLLALSLCGLQVNFVHAGNQAQIPTVSIPTVTSSPQGAMVTVTREYDQINVRGGPGGDYPIVGVLIAGQQVPALGRSFGGMWIQIIYPGGPDGVAWVYSPLVELIGSLPIVEPPATPTPRTTPRLIQPWLPSLSLKYLQPVYRHSLFLRRLYYPLFSLRYRPALHPESQWGC